ncbi:uncharacterized protein EV420DRAFT_1650169 [Desarmillaria tabescens]|uniref:Ricin B lectin domain-containing protein n=1 Tax=Armillaria tabescens TaxID=1929756 RepID=A0AA39JIU6_ARMTA|nr:uncharacterized protein EV420DRAFT_1650169 [Desarmillaria tabescens]KAK0441253.1 hypothetical protein EV420DRAFT_1650169 [Desarmillaria tabescens]
MSSSTILFFFSALFFAAASASPLAARGTCHPNFEGACSHCVYPEWCTLVFFFQQNGSPVVSYTVKTEANNNFAVELKGNALFMNNVDWSGSNVNQKWMVDCTMCSTDISQKKGVVASGCTITSNTNNGLCVTAKPNAQMTLTPCSNSGDQQFNFSV